jgi:hypothetical protein
VSADVVYATETASVALPDGGMVTIHEGKPYATNHPVVLRCPGFFSADPVHGIERSVETATAVPGERRSNPRR